MAAELAKNEWVDNVISVGGFLGIGDRLVAVPATLFTSNKKGQVVFPNGKKEDLEALPEFKYTK